MKYVLCSLLGLVFTVFASVDQVQAATFGIGDTINLDTDCGTIDGCTLSGAPSALGTTGFDLSYWTFVGSANTTYQLGVLSSVDAQVAFTVGSPIGVTGAGASNVQNFLEDVPGFIQIGFGTTTEQILNWITPSGSVTDVASTFDPYSTYVPPDPDDHQPPAVPLPAGLPLLLAGIGGLAVLRRYKKA